MLFLSYCVAPAVFHCGLTQSNSSKTLLSQRNTPAKLFIQYKGILIAYELRIKFSGFFHTTFFRILFSCLHMHTRGSDIRLMSFEISLFKYIYIYYYLATFMASNVNSWCVKGNNLTFSRRQKVSLLLGVAVCVYRLRCTKFIGLPNSVQRFGEIIS